MDVKNDTERRRDIRLKTSVHGREEPLLSLLAPQPRFGDKLLTVRVLCPHIRDCGAKRGKQVSAARTEQHEGEHHIGLGTAVGGDETEKKRETRQEARRKTEKKKT